MEQSLWKALPHYLRRVSNALKKVCLQIGFGSSWIFFHVHTFFLMTFLFFLYFFLLTQHTGRPLPLTCTPIKFGSWMGGDRDGNPNVTAKVRCLQLFIYEMHLFHLLKIIFSRFLH